MNIVKKGLIVMNDLLSFGLGLACGQSDSDDVNWKGKYNKICVINNRLKKRIKELENQKKMLQAYCNRYSKK